MLPEILSEQGWNTYMVGKWHLCPTDEMSLASTRRNWPSGRGFERWYGFFGAETNQWFPDLVYDNHFVDQPRSRRRRATTSPTTSPTRRWSSSRTPRRLHPRSPSFSTTPPAPAMRRITRRRSGSRSSRASSTRATRRCGRRHWPGRRSWGWCPPTPSCPPINPIGTPETRTVPTASRSRSWTSPDPGIRSTTTRRRLFARMAEVYAGFLGHADYNIGRLLDYLEANDELDNTLIVLVSDNGASGEGGPNGSVNEMKFANGVADDLAQNLAQMDELGSTRTYNHYPTGWAMAFNTPFKMWKRYEFNGGTCDPCIISWPAGAPRRRGDPRAVLPRRRHRADHPGPAWHRCPRDHQGAHPEPDRRGEHAVQHRRRIDAVGTRRRSSTPCSAPGPSGTTGGRRSRRTRRSRVEPLQRRRVGALPHRRRSRRDAQPGGRAPGQAP